MTIDYTASDFINEFNNQYRRQLNKTYDIEIYSHLVGKVNSNNVEYISGKVEFSIMAYDKTTDDIFPIDVVIKSSQDKLHTFTWNVYMDSDNVSQDTMNYVNGIAAEIAMYLTEDNYALADVEIESELDLLK